MPLKSWSEKIKDAETNTSGFEALGVGSYSFVIENPAKIGQTKKGLNKFSINPSVESGPRAKARIWHDFNETESSYAMNEYFFKPIYAIGIPASFFQSNPEPTNEQIAAAFQGKRFSATVEMETGTDGVERARLTNFAPASGAAPAPTQPGVPNMPTTTQAPAQPAAPAPQPVAEPVAAAQSAPPVADPAPAAQPAPQATPPAADDGNPWAAAPPPPPVF